MKKYFIFPLLLVLAVVLASAIGAFSDHQCSRSLQRCRWKTHRRRRNRVDSLDNGHKYTLKTNNKGEYFSLGMVPANTTSSSAKMAKRFSHQRRPIVLGDSRPDDIDLKKEQALNAAGQGMTPEQLKAEQEQREKANKEAITSGRSTTSSEANADIDCRRFRQCHRDPERCQHRRSHARPDLVPTGRCLSHVCAKQTDPDEKKKRYETAVADYQKAIDLRNASEQAAKDPENNKKLAAYYNNLAEAYSKDNKFDDAVADYNKAAQLDPEAQLPTTSTRAPFSPMPARSMTRSRLSTR